MIQKSEIDSAWITKGKTIRQLIKELKTFENQDMKVEISLDDGVTCRPISLVGRSGDVCVLMNCGSLNPNLK